MITRKDFSYPMEFAPIGQWTTHWLNVGKNNLMWTTNYDGFMIRVNDFGIFFVYS